MKVLQKIITPNKQNSILIDKKENVYEIKQDYSNFINNQSASNSYLLVNSNNQKMKKESTKNSEIFCDNNGSFSPINIENTQDDCTSNLPRLSLSKRKFSEDIYNSSNFNCYSNGKTNNLPEIKSDFNKINQFSDDTNPYNSSENFTPKQNLMFHSSASYYKKSQNHISPLHINIIQKKLIIPNEKDEKLDFRLNKFIQMLYHNENPIQHCQSKKSRSQIVHLRKKIQNNEGTMPEAYYCNFENNKNKIKNCNELSNEKSNNLYTLKNNEMNTKSTLMNKTGRMLKNQIQHLLKDDKNHNGNNKSTIIKNIKLIQKNHEIKEWNNPAKDNSKQNTIQLENHSISLNAKNSNRKSLENPYNQAHNFSTLNSNFDDYNNNKCNDKWNELKIKNIFPTNDNSKEKSKIVKRNIITVNDPSRATQIKTVPFLEKTLIKIEKKKNNNNNHVDKEDKSTSTEINHSENSSKSSIVTFGNN